MPGIVRSDNLSTTILWIYYQHCYICRPNIWPRPGFNSLQVFRPCDPFQVVGRIIRTVSVNVIHFQILIWARVPGRCNDPGYPTRRSQMIRITPVVPVRIAALFDELWVCTTEMFFCKRYKCSTVTNSNRIWRKQKAKLFRHAIGVAFATNHILRVIWKLR